MFDSIPSGTALVIAFQLDLNEQNADTETHEKRGKSWRDGVKNW